MRTIVWIVLCGDIIRCWKEALGVYCIFHWVHSHLAENRYMKKYDEYGFGLIMQVNLNIVLHVMTFQA